jgi:hypothetical protein
MRTYAAGENPPEGVMRIKPDLVAPGAYLVAANSRGDPAGAKGAHTSAFKSQRCAYVSY